MNTECKIDEKKKPLKERIKTIDFWRSKIFVILGASIGLQYHLIEGAKSTTFIAFTNPFSSILVGGLIAYFILNRPCKSC